MNARFYFNQWLWWKNWHRLFNYTQGCNGHSQDEHEFELEVFEFGGWVRKSKVNHLCTFYFNIEKNQSIVEKMKLLIRDYNPWWLWFGYKEINQFLQREISSTDESNSRVLRQNIKLLKYLEIKQYSSAFNVYISSAHYIFFFFI